MSKEPVSMLLEQANNLSKKTNGLLRGKVLTRRRGVDNLCYSFCIEAPTTRTDFLRYRIVWL